MFDSEEPDPNVFPVEDDLFKHDDLLYLEDFVATTLDLWEQLQTDFEKDGDKETAKDFKTAIDLLKHTYSTRELIDLVSYERQMTTPRTRTIRRPIQIKA